jgi:hypothetical protein
MGKREHATLAMDNAITPACDRGTWKGVKLGDHHCQCAGQFAKQHLTIFNSY